MCSNAKLSLLLGPQNKADTPVNCTITKLMFGGLLGNWYSEADENKWRSPKSSFLIERFRKPDRKRPLPEPKTKWERRKTWKRRPGGNGSRMVALLAFTSHPLTPAKGCANPCKTVLRNISQKCRQQTKFRDMFSCALEFWHQFHF